MSRMQGSPSIQRRGIAGIVSAASLLSDAFDMEVCEAMNRLGYRTQPGKQWRYPQQIIKLLRSCGSEG